jgi:IS5 family transposase
MYEKQENQILLPDDFFLPFEGKLNKENRWVLKACLIPWWRAEEKYANRFKSVKGNKALSVRIALGSLIIQEHLGTSDRETVEQIKENPYLQYFIGLPGFQEKAPFHHSLMTHFRKRLGKDIINEVNEWIALEEPHQDSRGPSDDDDPSSNTTTPEEEHASQSESQPSTNKGKLLLDATCVPVDMAYPTDLNLLNEAREKLEKIIDTLHHADRGKKKKPRTYRQKARRAYLSIAKQRQVSQKKVRNAVKQQLQYVKRDLRIVSQLAEHHGLSLLNRKQYRQLLVIQELYRQQKEMHEKRTHRIDDRIVSIHQPHVRPMVRGKAKANVEFGPKLAISLVEGYVFMEEMKWDNYNESKTLQASVESYHKRFGHYPEAVLADKIYRNRENFDYCKQLGIRLSGPKLGRPTKDKQAEQKRIARQDAAERNAVEGKIGQGKRRFGLGLIQACLRETSETVVALQLLVMNLEQRLRFLFHLFLHRLMFMCLRDARTVF